MISLLVHFVMTTGLEMGWGWWCALWRWGENTRSQIYGKSVGMVIKCVWMGWG